MDPWLLIVIGVVLLALGGETLVRGSVAAARALGVSPLLIGLTLVGFGTSTPELVTSIQAALKGSPGLAFGNIVGSNTANILLILGLTALLRPIDIDRAAFRRDGAVMLLATIACVACVLYGRLTPLIGATFLAALGVYVLVCWLQERRPVAAPSAGASVPDPGPGLVPEPSRRPRILPGVLLAVGGVALTVVGAGLLVDGAIVLARASGVSETVIGLTIVAVGTSLPELVASLMAALRGRSDLALGNILGSNIYNVLGILGLTALIRPIPAPPELARLDVWVMLAAAVLLLAQRNLRVGRREGLIMLLCYGLYLIVLTRLGGG